MPCHSIFFSGAPEVVPRPNEAMDGERTRGPGFFSVALGFAPSFWGLELPMKSPPLGASRLLHLDPRDRAGLCWLRNRARFWLTALERRRKFLPRGEPFSPEEVAAIRALVALEEAAGELLTNVGKELDDEKERGTFSP